MGMQKGVTPGYLLKLVHVPHVNPLTRRFLTASATALYVFLFGRRRREAE